MAQVTLDAVEAHASQYWLDGLRQKADLVAEHAAILAHEAEGVASAIGFALWREI
jgi:hypothetical protein